MGVEHGLLLEEHIVNFECLTIMFVLLITIYRSQENQASKILWNVWLSDLCMSPNYCCSRDSSVGGVTRLPGGQLRNLSSITGRIKTFLPFSTTSIKPPLLWVPGSLSWGRAWNVPLNLHLLSKLRSVELYLYYPPCLHGLHGESLTFTVTAQKLGS